MQDLGAFDDGRGGDDAEDGSSCGAVHDFQVAQHSAAGNDDAAEAAARRESYAMFDDGWLQVACDVRHVTCDIQRVTFGRDVL